MSEEKLENKNMEYIDIHSHILPCVDDGSANMEMSLRMLQTAYKEGIRKIILTPHNKPSHKNISEKSMQSLLEQVKEAAEKEKIEIDIYIGNEIYYRSEIIALLKNKKICTMANSSYALVEFSPMDNYEYIRNGIYQLLAEGYLPILAHTERYEKLHSNPCYIKDLFSMGCYIQINAGSVVGRAGYREKIFSRYMLKQRLVHFVATDAHNDKKRSPNLTDCIKYIEKKYGKEYKNQLLYQNPMAVIANECIQ